MNNPLYQMLGNKTQNNVPDFMSRFQQFRNSFSGDPKQMVQNMLNSGKVTQAQYNQAVNLVNQMINLIK